MPLPVSVSGRYAQRRPDLRGNLVKRRRIGDGDFAQRLAVQGDVRLEQPVDELAVAQPACRRRRGKPRDPERPILALLELAVVVAVIPRAQQRFMRCLVQLAAPADETLGSLEQPFVPLLACGADAYPWHKYLESKRSRERTDNPQQATPAHRPPGPSRMIILAAKGPVMVLVRRSR